MGDTSRSREEEHSYESKRRRGVQKNWSPVREYITVGVATVALLATGVQIAREYLVSAKYDFHDALSLSLRHDRWSQEKVGHISRLETSPPENDPEVAYDHIVNLYVAQYSVGDGRKSEEDVLKGKAAFYSYLDSVCRPGGISYPREMKGAMNIQKMNALLESRMGYVVIESDPSVCEIMSPDEKRVYARSGQVIALPTGKHKLKVKDGEGFEPLIVEVSIRAFVQIKVSVKLTSLKGP